MIRRRLQQLFTRAAVAADIDEELAFHIDMETARLQATGLTPPEARRRARIAFGAHDRAVEETRDARSFAWLENAWRDVRFGLRGLVRNPAFTTVAVLTLAIGIGATTAVFSFADALLFRPVPGVRAADELVVIEISGEGGFSHGISHANIEDLRAGTPALMTLAGHTGRTMQARADDGAPFEVNAAIVQGGYFEVLGLTPQRGRWFTQSEAAPDAAGDAIIISDRFWKSRLGGSADVIGRSMELNAGRYTVVGVAPESFGGADRMSGTDVWLPPAAYGRMWHRPVNAADRQTSMFSGLIGRLAPGAAPVQVQQQLHATLATLAARYPDINGIYAELEPTVHAGIGVPVGARARTIATVRLLFGVVCVLLLIACANVANLLLLRGASRRGETAVRRALGASGARLVQQHMTEGLLLSLLGGSAGVAIAVVMSVLFRGQQLPGLDGVPAVALDWRMIAFALIAALVTGVVCTLAPALASRAAPLSAALHSAGRSGGGDGTAQRSMLTVVQVAASLTLLVGALLLMRTVDNLHGIDRGFDADAVSAYGFDPSPQGYDDEAARALRRRLLDEAAALPGITSASMSSALPVPGDAMMARLSVPGRAGIEPITVASFDVSADWFTTLGTAILAGRAFTAAEQHDQPSPGAGVVLGEAAARALFGTGDVVGRTVNVHGFTGTTARTVIGVAEDVRIGARDEVTPVLYQPLGAAALSQGYLLVRSRLTRSQTEDAVGTALARLDGSIPLFQASSLGDGFRRANAEERLLATLLGLFAALAVTLAAIGLYGVIAWSVARRHREIGVRMALGARASGVVRLVVRQSVLLLCAGVLLGTLGGYALSRVLGSRMYGITALDPSTYLLAIGGFTLVAVLASALPARAAARIDPMETLREQ